MRRVLCQLVLAITILSTLILTGCASSSSTTSTTSSSSANESSSSGPLDDLAFLTGVWRTDASGGTFNEEFWTPPRAGSMFGINRMITGEHTVFFEFLRIELAADGGVIYHASPKGRSPATPFRMVECKDGRATFANPDHDFPQRIIYELVSHDELVARIEGEVNGVARSSEWRYHPAN